MLAAPCTRAKLFHPCRHPSQDAQSECVTYAPQNSIRPKKQSMKSCSPKAGPETAPCCEIHQTQKDKQRVESKPGGSKSQVCDLVLQTHPSPQDPESIPNPPVSPTDADGSRNWVPARQAGNLFTSRQYGHPGEKASPWELLLLISLRLSLSFN